MKKTFCILFSIILCILTTIPSFANEIKDIDLTQDNFQPAIGKTAPDNWYDAYAYDESGELLTGCGCIGDWSFCYCETAQKVFALHYMDKNLKWHTTYKGDVRFEGEDTSSIFCPYCGKCEITGRLFGETHILSNDIIYGFFCPECGGFYASNSYLTDVSCRHCYHCYNFKTTPDNVKYYRFLSEEDRNAPYAWLFEETAYKYGDGVDGNVEDLRMDSVGAYIDWKPGAGPEFSLKQFLSERFQKFVRWFLDLFSFLK